METMNDIIEWCNINSGFIQAILALLTLIVSIIAIVVSIKTANLPYKKKIVLTFGSYIGVGFIDDGIHVTCINCGNRAFHIKKLGLFVKPNRVYINFNSISESQIRLDGGSETTQYFTSNYLREEFKKYDGSTKVYAYVEDTEGTIKKKYICRINQIKEK